MSDFTQTRRATILAALAMSGGGGALAATSQAPASAPTGHEHDWDWLVGKWNVKHERLNGRLVGSTEWETFDGTSELWLTLGGLGTIDDNVIHIPSGSYRAVGLRAFDPKAGKWLIWWLDGRNPEKIEPPVAGGFKDGRGVFEGEDVLNGRPIKVRFEWSRITKTSAHWEQAFSPDGGRTWEVNWRMDFTRA